MHNKRKKETRNQIKVLLVGQKLPMLQNLLWHTNRRKLAPCGDLCACVCDRVFLCLL